MTPIEFFEKYRNQKGQIKGGTLCFWGHWFGRPYDNIHQILSVDFDLTTNTLIIIFAGKETLTVINPSDIEDHKDRLQINKADRVYWQWYHYGKTQEQENLCYYDIVRNESILDGSTNVNWYEVNWNDLKITKPAVLLT